MKNEIANWTHCFDNYTDYQYQLDDAKLRDVYKWIWLWLPMPFVLFALLLVLTYTLVVCVAIRRKSISLHNYRYLFFLNRSFGDLIGCAAMLTACLYIMLNEYNYLDYTNIPVICDVILFATYWSAMVTYVSLSLLRLFLVAKPFLYQRMITIRRCIAFIGVSWLPAIIVVVTGLFLHAMVREEKLHRIVGRCLLESCIRLMYRIRHVAFIVVYVSTLSIYALTLLLLLKANQFRNSLRPTTAATTKSSLMPQSKLPSMGVGIFALLHSPHLVYGIYVLQTHEKCFWQWNRPAMMSAWGIIRALLIIRIIVDTMLSFVLDNNLRVQFSSLLLPIRQSISKQRLVSSAYQSTISNDAVLNPQVHATTINPSGS